MSNDDRPEAERPDNARTAAEASGNVFKRGKHPVDVSGKPTGADKAAAKILAGLEQPFTTSQARQALRTSRRVAIPLLEYLDRARVTERLPGDLRRIRG